MVDVNINIPKVYTLTEIIGKGAGADRTAEVATFEMSRRAFWGLLIGLLAGVPVATVFALFLGPWASIVFPASAMLGAFMARVCTVDVRSTRTWPNPASWWKLKNPP